ncbi:MAG: hypothetical protein A3H42_03060, partial [Deltaproteobacteria bacterium RIFCSPLOWO2_02_FULL_46_8]
MPTIFKKEGYRFFFYSADFLEPKHVHVEYGGGTAKFWLSPLQLVSSYGMKGHQLKKARILIMEHVALIEERWNEFF